MKVLVACEFSGTVRDAFIRRGHDAMSCDLLPTESPGPHHQGDVLEIIKAGWDLMIAHPPCTFLSGAGNRWLYPKGKLNQERYSDGLVAKEFFLQLFNSEIPKIAIENPVPTLIYELPKYTQIIHPYEHGHQFKKRTCLWLKNLPLLVASNIIHKRESTRMAGNWFNKGGKERQKNRAKTFLGIADAMAAQWG